MKGTSEMSRLVAGRVTSCGMVGGAPFFWTTVRFFDALVVFQTIT